MNMQNAITALIVIWCIFIAIRDFQSNKIPNSLILLMLLPALLVLIFNGKGLLGVAIKPSLIGFLLAFVVFLPGYAFGKLGAGDVKFAAVLGLLLGGWSAADMLVIASVLIGAQALIWKIFLPIKDSRFPAGVALAIAAIIELFLGNLVITPQLVG